VGRKQAKGFTAEEKLQIVLAGFEEEATVTELCRRQGDQPAHLLHCRGKILSGATAGALRAGRLGCISSCGESGVMAGSTALAEMEPSR
jgi:transposase-like protein